MKVNQIKCPSCGKDPLMDQTRIVSVMGGLFDCACGTQWTQPVGGEPKILQGPTPPPDATAT